MKNDYDKIFNQEIERILNKMYYQPINNNGRDKRTVVDWDYKYTQYLIDNELIRYINLHSPTGVMLKTNGYEVFEKYSGWKEYKEKVLDVKNKVNNAKDMAQRFWWIPVVISTFALIASIIAIFK